MSTPCIQSYAACMQGAYDGMQVAYDRMPPACRLHTIVCMQVAYDRMPPACRLHTIVCMGSTLEHTVNHRAFSSWMHTIVCSLHTIICRLHFTIVCRLHASLVWRRLYAAVVLTNYTSCFKKTSTHIIGYNLRNTVKPRCLAPRYLAKLAARHVNVKD